MLIFISLYNTCSYIFDFFARAGLDPSTYTTLMEQCSKAIAFLTTTGKSLHRNGNNVQKLLDAIKVAKCMHDMIMFLKIVHINNFYTIF